MVAFKQEVVTQAEEAGVFLAFYDKTIFCIDFSNFALPIEQVERVRTKQKFTFASSGFFKNLAEWQKIGRVRTHPELG